MISSPADEVMVAVTKDEDGVQVPVKMPSPAIRSGAIPLSRKIKLSPLLMIAVTGPTGSAQLMLITETICGAPTVGTAGNCRTESRGLFVQLSDSAALILLPVKVLPVKAATVSPPVRIRFRKA